MYIAKKIKELTKTFIAHANNLAAEHEHYVGEFVTRGHQELYKILAAMYEIYLAIEQSEGKDYTIKVLRDELRKNHSIKTAQKSSNLGVFIRYVTRASTKTVSVYKRVLGAAAAAKISPENLSEFITKNGGVDKCGKAIVDAEIRKQQNMQSEIYKKAMWKHVETSAPIAVVNFPNGKVPMKPGAVDVKFTHLLCNYNNSTMNFEVVCLLYPSSDIEERAFDLHMKCCKAASLDDGTGKFANYCKEQGLNMDNIHRWMAIHAIKDHQAAKAELLRLQSIAADLQAKQSDPT
jgi:hypothetical protein